MKYRECDLKRIYYAMDYCKASIMKDGDLSAEIFCYSELLELFCITCVDKNFGDRWFHFFHVESDVDVYTFRAVNDYDEAIKICDALGIYKKGEYFKNKGDIDE